MSDVDLFIIKSMCEQTRPELICDSGLILLSTLHVKVEAACGDFHTCSSVQVVDM